MPAVSQGVTIPVQLVQLVVTRVKAPLSEFSESFKQFVLAIKVS